MKTAIRNRIAVLVLILTVVVASNASADVKNVQHAATISVPAILELSADTSSFTLTMPDFISGTESNTKTVVYTVRSNDMQVADGGTVMDAAIDFDYDRLALKGQVGSYTATAGGNTGLTAAAAGYMTISTTNVALAKKANTTAGSDGKILKGTLPVTYKAVATADVPAGDQTHLLFVNITSR